MAKSIINKVFDAKKYIDKNYANINGLQDISDFVHCNYHTLRAEFVRQLNFTLGKYLNKVRCIKAREYLLTTDWKLYKIATKVGIKNEKYLIRVFEKYYNLPPNHYRKHVN